MRVPALAFFLCATVLAGWSPLFPHTAQAQMGMRGRYGPRYGEAQDFVGFNFSDVEPSAVRSPAPGEGGTLQSQETRAYLSVPVWGWGSDTVWSAGLAAETLTLHFAGFSPALAPALVSDLYGAAFIGSVFHRVDNGQAWLAYLATGEFSDGWPPEGQQRTSGGAIWQVRTSPSSTFGLGGGFTFVFGEPRAVPIVSYAYREGRWSANVRLPFRGDVRYSLSEWTRVGAEYFVQGGEFSVRDPAAAVDTVRYTSQLAGVLLAIGPAWGPQLQLDAGTTLYRHYTARDNGNTVLSLGFKDAAFYRMGVAVRF